MIVCACAAVSLSRFLFQAVDRSKRSGTQRCRWLEFDRSRELSRPSERSIDRSIFRRFDRGPVVARASLSRVDPRSNAAEDVVGRAFRGIRVSSFVERRPEIGRATSSDLGWIHPVLTRCPRSPSRVNKSSNKLPKKKSKPVKRALFALYRLSKCLSNLTFIV